MFSGLRTSSWVLDPPFLKQGLGYIVWCQLEACCLGICRVSGKLLVDMAGEAESLAILAIA